MEAPVACIEFLSEYYGIPQAVFEKYVVLRANKKRFQIYPKHLDRSQLGSGSSFSMPGLGLARATMVQPKLSTAAARLLGSFASQNYIELRADELENYFNRRSFCLARDRFVGPQRGRQMLVRYLGQGMGIGELDLNESQTYTLRSLYPKGWSLASG